jgi:thymidine phosphorylase
VAICEAQGGMREIPKSKYVHKCFAQKSGVISIIDNRRIALVAKLAGAPLDKTAGVDLFIKTGKKVIQGEEIFAIHTDSPETLEYALDYFKENLDLIQIT